MTAEVGFLTANVNNANDTTDKLISVDKSLELPVGKKFLDVIFFDLNVLAGPSHFPNSDPVTARSIYMGVGMFGDQLSLDVVTVFAENIKRLSVPGFVSSIETIRV